MINNEQLLIHLSGKKHAKKKESMKKLNNPIESKKKIKGY